MPSLKDTRRRIGSVKNTQKITRAMKLVSAAKFARANHACTQARAYSTEITKLLGEICALLKNESDFALQEEARFFEDSSISLQGKKSLVILLSSDRGLCGGLNNTLFKKTLLWCEQKQEKSFDFWAWGKRSILFTRKTKFNVSQKREKLTEKPSYDVARQISEELFKRFSEGEFSEVYVAYNEFKSAMTQTPVVEKILPISPSISSDKKTEDFLIEPKDPVIVREIIKKYLANVIFKAFLESAASEHGARMTAMDSATNNAREVIRKLTLQYNRARQAAITKELIEIISGAEAL